MENEQLRFEFEQKKTIKGYPELHWTGKRPFKSTVYYPAQLKESYGSSHDNWINKIFWGDNLQVMSHLLKDYSGKIDLIYIDPPFDSDADYKKKIKLKDKEITNDRTTFEEKQYGDIWANDDYLQFMYERLILMLGLLSDKGSIYLHCDWHKSHHLRMLMDEVFGLNNFKNEIIWLYKTGGASKDSWAKKHDTLLMYVKKDGDHIFNLQKEKSFMMHKYGFSKSDFKIDEETGLQYSMVFCRDVWDLPSVGSATSERVDYPTQKPELLLERIINASSNPGSIVFDCFMGSGTTQAVSMKLGRRFIGADINLGAIQTTTKRLLKIAEDNKKELIGDTPMYTGFEVYNVNNYEIFRNPLEARTILLQTLEVEPFDSTSVYDGEKDGRMIKIMPENINRIATKADINGFISNLPYKIFERKKEENPNADVLKLTVYCMGHEADLAAAIKQALHKYKVDIEVVDILTDRKDLQFKREAEGEITIENGKLVIKNFYPLNLLQKLSLQKENVDEWRQLVENVMVDFNYDGAVLSPTVIDSPDKNDFVKGIYDIPKNAGKIKVKITDLLSESLELEAEVK